MEPTVQRVAEAVQEMLARPWPATRAELDPWLRWHHLEGARAEGTGALLDWGDAAGVLNFHGDCFVGVNLFLWSGVDPVELIERFRRLGEAFDLLVGEATERWGATGQPAALWKGASHTIEMYAHTGAGPCVQLSVADAALADAAEAESRARQSAASHPLAALGSPADADSFATALHQTAELADRGEMIMDTIATSDLVDEIGPGVRSCDLQLRDLGGRTAFSGRIATIRCHEDNALVKRICATAGEGRVLVVDGGGSLRTALMGDQIAESARANGWAGAVIHGAIRDSAVIGGLDFGVKALGTNPRKSAKDGVGETDVVVSFGGIDFVPGEMLYADADGIVVRAE